MLTLVQVRCGRELPLVLVLVTIQTAVELDLVQRLFSFRDVALRAHQGGMLALQRVGSGLMLFQPELCRFETIYRVAGSARPAVQSFCKLALMVILVAVLALPECKRLLEIAPAMAGNTVDLLVFSEQRIAGFGVIKGLVERRWSNALPPAGVMTGLATLLREAALMRVAVAIRTFVERQPGVTGSIVGARRVALLTLDLHMQPGKRVACLGMIKLPGGVLPVGVVVALRTILPETATVRILVAGRAGSAQPEERPGHVVNLDQLLLRGRNPGRSMAAAAG